MKSYIIYKVLLKKRNRLPVSDATADKEKITSESNSTSR